MAKIAQIGKNFGIRTMTVEDMYRTLIKFNKMLKQKGKVSVRDLYSFTLDEDTETMSNTDGWDAPISSPIKHRTCYQFTHLVMMPQTKKLLEE